jgi:hypothetical protein
MPVNKKKKRYIRSPYIFLELLIIAVVAFVILYKVTDHFGNKTKPISASAYTKGIIYVKPNKSSDSSSNSNGSSTSGSQSSANNNTSASSGSNTTTAVLQTPTGDFVSDHHPNLSGSPAPNTMASTCTTTPGASCIIQFTNTSTGTVKSLNTQITDAGGSAYWNYTLQGEGLTAGTWKVAATASLNGNTLSAQDAMDLTVSQ